MEYDINNIMIDKKITLDEYEIELKNEQDEKSIPDN